ncbi:DUF721 domain-containing protein [Cryomorpha ignava]|uniref:DUF721 domain-containing protein n=1 Tax=Cryomorpha ignava TaxID=101383 RepID=A0A7K3WQF3_9FLAO|nr:DUF721 domain-containing protein [Cryomorpha ignava]NEN23890.1 DUF721 domain-containing protein [Cryomorpha ignava]
MSRNENEETLGDAINRLLKAYGLEEGYYAAAVVTHWEKLMGPAVSRRTQSIKIQKGVLIVKIESAALRQELSYSKDKIMTQINRELGVRIIKSVELR